MTVVRTVPSPPWRRGWVCVALALVAVAAARASTLRVEVGGRSGGDWRPLADEAVRRHTQRLMDLTDRSRFGWERSGRLRGPVFLPLRVVLTRDGRELPGEHRTDGRDPDDIVPTFDDEGSRAFPPPYRRLLERTFAAARPAMNAVFGRPAAPGRVRVRNYEADIQARLAVVGGYYVPNAPEGPEVRLPVYNNPVAASVNYVHTLLLAYQGLKPYPFDAYQEGVVRAATMAVARTPGSLPDAPQAEQIEAVLGGLYDVGPVYDWLNQPGLGARWFIAPNLLDAPLPPGGSTGGPYLLRYQMAGTAWAKVLVEAPGFLAEFNKRYYAAPDLYRSAEELEVLGQAALDAVRMEVGSSIEGLRFTRWVARQWVLDPSGGAGLRALLQVVPLPPTPGSPDFGVFGIELNAVRLSAAGNETLLGGVSYPIYWRPDFSRAVLTAQDDRIDVAAGYGSVAPNFPRESFGGQPYRMTVDVPFGNRVARVSLPAGAIATGANPTERTFAGTISGFPAPTTGSYFVSVEWPGGQQGNIPVANFAFGARLDDPGFLRPGLLTVRVFRRDGSTNVEILRRRVNKTAGPVYLDLVPPEADATFDVALPARLALAGLPVDPYRAEPSRALGLDPLGLLLGAWNPVTARYDLYPDEGQLRRGRGFWVRASDPYVATVEGRSVPRIPATVALEPGWNLASVPFSVPARRADVLVAVGSEAPVTFADAVARGLVGSVAFGWEPDPANPDSGMFVENSLFPPGQATFIRVNRPEGAVLVFFPQDSTAPTTRGRERAPQVQWEAVVSLQRSNRPLGAVRLGQSPEARGSLDPRLTLDPVPTLGGVRIWSASGTPLYRDVRPSGPPAHFTLVMDGLDPGEMYTLNFRALRGRVTLSIGDGGSWSVLRRASHSFRAAGPRAVVHVRAVARR